jgi:hypothetical protein
MFISCDRSDVFHHAHQQDLFGGTRSLCGRVLAAHSDTKRYSEVTGRPRPVATVRHPRQRRECFWCGIWRVPQDEREGYARRFEDGKG